MSSKDQKSSPTKGTPAAAGSTTRTPSQLRQHLIRTGKLWFSFTGMECCPVEKGPAKGPSLPCGRPANGEILRCQSVLCADSSEDLQVKVCKGCSHLTGRDSLLRAFPRGHLNAHTGRSTAVVPLSNTKVYDKFRAMSEADFTATVLAGTPRLCLSTFPTFGDVVDYITEGEETSGAESQGSHSVSAAHPVVCQAWLPGGVGTVGRTGPEGPGPWGLRAGRPGRYADNAPPPP